MQRRAAGRSPRTARRCDISGGGPGRPGVPYIPAVAARMRRRWLCPGPPGGNVRITLRSSFVSIYFTDRIPALNARVSAARQTHLGSTVCMPGLGPGGLVLIATLRNGGVSEHATSAQTAVHGGGARHRRDGFVRGRLRLVIERRRREQRL